jgi:hypothetical protein
VCGRRITELEELGDDVLVGYYDLWLCQMDLRIQDRGIEERRTAFGCPAAET